MEDTLDPPRTGFDEMRVESDAEVDQQVMAPVSKPRSRPGHVRITSTLSTKGRTQRGAGVSSSDGQGPTSLTQTIGQSQYNTHEFQSSIKGGAKAAASQEQIQEMEEQSLLTAGQQRHLEEPDYEGTEVEMQHFSRGPLYHLREGEEEGHEQAQRFRTLNPTSEQ